MVGLLLAIVVAVLAVSTLPSVRAFEVQTAETHLYPIRLRGAPYVLSVTSYFSYDFEDEDEASEKTEEAAVVEVEEQNSGDDVTIVTFFDDDEQSKNAIDSKEKEEDAGALIENIDMYWVQEQIDLLSRFESSLSLDQVFRHGRTGSGCSRRFSNMVEEEEETMVMVEGEDMDEVDVVEEYREVDIGFSPLYHPNRKGRGGQGQVQRPPANVGMLILSVIITFLYCVVVFGIIYLVLSLIKQMVNFLWQCAFGSCSGSEDDEEPEEEEDESVYAVLLADESTDSSDLSTHQNPLLQPLCHEPAQETTYVDLKLVHV